MILELIVMMTNLSPKINMTLLHISTEYSIGRAYLAIYSFIATRMKLPSFSNLNVFKV